MHAAVIDTLKFADRLKESGFEPPQAEGLARALGDELAERMVTKRDLDDATQSVLATIETTDAKFEAKFGAMDQKFEARFDTMDQKFGTMDQKFEARFGVTGTKFEARFGAMDGKSEAKFEAIQSRFDAIDAKLESLHREFSGKFNVLFGTMALGFTLTIGLIGYSLFSARPAEPSPSTVPPTMERSATR